MFDPVIDVKRSRGGAYCGPSAISILTGVPISHIENMIRRRRRGGYRDRNGRRIPVQGTHTGEVVSVLEALGCKVEPIKVEPERVPIVRGWGHSAKWPTFGTFVKDMHHVGAMLVEVTGHWMVAERGMIADSSFPKAIPIQDYPRAMRRVKAAWKVIAPEVPHYSPPVKREKPKRDVTEARYAKTMASLKRWQAKKKRAETAISKLVKTVRYYERKKHLTSEA